MKKRSKDGNGNKDLMQSEPTDPLLVVGIGASAGGIRALKEFFTYVPEKSDLAYVVILHLSPEHESHLAEVLQTSAKLPVHRVDDGTVDVRPNNVYVISPNRSLSISDGTLTASQITRNEERRAPVDIFFRTLAESKESRAVSVVLSGTGSDGSMGIKRVKEKGGIVIAQDPTEAEYADMPQNTISTGLVDYVLPVADIPQKINEYRRQLGKVEIDVPEDETAQKSDEAALNDIFVTMRAGTGHDFINYKRASVLRRIERRMNVNHLTDLKDYARFLRQNRDEAQALLKDLLISVTNFFRDPAAFEYLETDIVPKILEGKTAKDFVRVWVAGCASGEEAYSLAMIFAEQTQGKLNAPGVQIFATDIDTNAITIARTALYTAADVADVSPERLQNFFHEDGDLYRVRREIREMVLFAIHNVIKDPPFSRLDLFTCRNLLIYLNRPAQRRVMETAHFSLNPNGYVFLGSSETADTEDNLFFPVNSEFRIYQRRNKAATLPGPIFMPVVPQGLRHFTNLQHSDEIRALERLSYAALHQQLLEVYAPPSVVVNQDYDILHISESAGRFMQITGGEPSKNLLTILRPELRLEVRTALYQCIQRRMPVSTNEIGVRTDSGHETVVVHVRPSLRNEDPDNGYLLIVFEPAAGLGKAIPPKISEDQPLTRQLEEELIHTKAQLSSTVEQYEVQHEELRASNEELQAINEELRSAVEEVETGKEELQSVNEELSTVNQELKIKIEELSQSNNDFQNLMNSTQVGTIFLDRSMRVKMFTQPAADIFNLIPGDVGRPLSDLATSLNYNEFAKDVKEVLKTLQPVERSVVDDRGRSFLVRTIPYRTSEDRIDGIVMTFVDISRRLRDEAELFRVEQRLQKALNIETVGIIFYNDRFRIVDCNDTFLKMIGLTRKDIEGGKLDWQKLTPPEWHEASKKAIDDLSSTGYVTPYEKEYVRSDGSRFTGLVAAARIGDNDVVEYVIDISTQKEAEKDLTFQVRLLEAVDQSVIATDINGTVTYWNPAAERLYGWTAKEAIGKPIASLTTPTTSIERATEIMDQLRSGKSWEGEFTVIRRDGSKFLAHVSNSPIFDDLGNVAGIVGVSTDVGDRRRTEAVLREVQDRMRMLVESATDYAIFTISADNLVTTWSPGAERTFGYKEDEIVGRSGELLFTPEDREKGVPEKEMRQARQSGSAEDERWHLRKDGTLFFASGVMQPLRSDGTRGFVKICRDQTEKLTAQNAIRDRQTLRRIVRTQEDERRRIARDLHDTLGQQLTALRLKLEAVKANYGAEPAMMKAIDETQAMAKQIDSDISFLNWELRPTALDNLGLRNALANYVAEWSKNFGISAEFLTSRLRLPRLSPEIEINLYRIVQEALNNTLKHAKASKVSVLLEFNQGDVVLVIEDDGRGFNPERRTRRTESGKGLGLIGMRERAALLGGKLTIESARGKGTTIIVRVPLQYSKTPRKKTVGKETSEEQ